MNATLNNIPKYIPVIDSLRGVAAMAVMLFHFICTTTDFIKNEWLLSVFYFGKFGVYMFFVISGIVIPLSLINNKYSPKSFFRFILKRIIRLDPPYFLALVIGIVASYVRLKVPGTAPIDTTPTAKEVLLHIGYLIPFFDNVRWLNPAFWTLAVEFQYYIILALTINLFASAKLFWRAMGYTLFLSLGVIGYYHGNEELVPIYLPLFLIGISYCTYLCGIIRAVEQLIVLILSCIILLFINDYEIVLTALITLICVYFFSSYSNRITKFFGNISYSVYLMHGIFGSAFVNVLSHGIENPYLKLGLIIAGIIITVAISYISYEFVEKPSKEFSSRISASARKV